MSDKLAPFRAIVGNITGQPPEWIDVDATGAATRRRRRTLLRQAAAPIQLLSQVHAPEEQLGTVLSQAQASVANGQLASALGGIGLTLIGGSGG